MQITKKLYPKIHFILPAGGVRGAFQGGFLYRMFASYKDKFDIARIDGSSVGAINGFCVVTNNVAKLYEQWHSCDSINNFYDKRNQSYVIGDILSAYQGFYECGLYTSTSLHTKMRDMKQNCTNITNKFSCIVTNMETARSEYITGDNEDIAAYITASASPWIATSPSVINGVQYTDGGLLETYPIQYVHKCNADLTIIVGHDKQWEEYVPEPKKNILEFAQSLITIARFNNKNTEELLKLIKEPDIITIQNTMNLNPIDFNPEQISLGFDEGTAAADLFYDTYVNMSVDL